MVRILDSLNIGDLAIDANFTLTTHKTHNNKNKNDNNSNDNNKWKFEV